jgi:hypothetical protein
VEWVPVPAWQCNHMPFDHSRKWSDTLYMSNMDVRGLYPLPLPIATNTNLSLSCPGHNSAGVRIHPMPPPRSGRCLIKHFLYLYTSSGSGITVRSEVVYIPHRVIVMVSILISSSSAPAPANQPQIQTALTYHNSMGY